MYGQCVLLEVRAHLTDGQGCAHTHAHNASEIISLVLNS